MYVAKDGVSNDLVAIKRVRVMTNSLSLESESRLLKESRSRFIVRYYDVLKRESELWVCYFLNE